MTGTWKNEGRHGWEYSGHGWGVYRVKKGGGKWHTFHEPFGAAPVLLGEHDSRKAAQKQAEGIVAGLAASKSARGSNPVKLINRPMFADAVELFRKSVAASRAHSDLAASSLAKYGSHGADVSGIVRTHFPTEVKNRLRELAREVGMYSDLAHKARPKGVRVETMRQLGREVATAEGSGFYGPQPKRNPRRRNPSKLPGREFVVKVESIMHPNYDYRVTVTYGRNKKTELVSGGMSTVDHVVARLKTALLSEVHARHPNPRRRRRRGRNPKGRYQVAALANAKGYEGRVIFYDGHGFSLLRSNAAVYGSTEEAGGAARLVADTHKIRVAVVPPSVTEAKIRAHLGKR